MGEISQAKVGARLQTGEPRRKGVSRARAGLAPRQLAPRQSGPLPHGGVPAGQEVVSKRPVLLPQSCARPQRAPGRALVCAECAVGGALSAGSAGCPAGWALLSRSSRGGAGLLRGEATQPAGREAPGPWHTCRLSVRPMALFRWMGRPRDCPVCLPPRGRPAPQRLGQAAFPSSGWEDLAEVGHTERAPSLPHWLGSGATGEPDQRPSVWGTRAAVQGAGGAPRGSRVHRSLGGGAGPGGAGFRH